MIRRVTSNAFANLTSGLSALAYQVALTAIATHSFGKQGFAVWAIALSTAAWVSLFTANLSMIVTRRLVEAPGSVAAVLQACKQLALWLSISALVVIELGAAGLLAKSKPLAGTHAGVFLLLVLLLSMVQLWQILLQPRFGMEYSFERNWRVSKTIVLLRVGGLAGILLFWFSKGTRTDVAALYLLGGTLVGILAGLGTHRAEKYSAALPEEVKAERRQIYHYLGAFALWSLGTAVIQSGLPAFLSLIAPERFSAFYLAYTLNVILVNASGTAAGALLAPVTRLRVNGRFRELKLWVTWAPAATGLILLGALLAMWYALPWIQPFYSGGVASVEEVRRPLFWLSLQTLMRLMCLVYSVVLSSAGKPAQLMRPIFVEVGITALLGLPLGWLHGESAFLCALAVAGAIASIYTMITTLQLSIFDKSDRRRLALLFVAFQGIMLLAWVRCAR